MQIRKLTRDEMKAAAAVHRDAFDDRLPWLKGLHTPEQDQAYFRGHVFDTCQPWGAFEDLRLVGIIAFREGWIDQLYVLPAWQGRGVGATLLGLATGSQSSLRLWTFQKNTGARRFYEKHGFRAVELTDGSRNEEREPDVLYEWRRPEAA